MHIVEIADIITAKSPIPVLDVRSEGEYLQGHMPLAINIPLLTNEERKEVGICYKQRGNEAAVLLGYALVGGRFAEMIRSISQLFPHKKVALHCWRGGLRSRIVAQLLDNMGFEVTLIKGGYKAYRNWVLKSFDTPLEVAVMGGLTGSGKTELLQLLREAGEQVIDLEGIAHHKGSTFGGIEQLPQPSQEQFENNLSAQYLTLDCSKRIWIEDESRRIGNVCIPLQLWDQMRDSTLFEIEVSYDSRLQRILKEYATLPIDKLTEKTMTLKKRLGDKHLNEILEFLVQKNMHAWAMALLNYYDKNYIYGQNKREALKRKKINLEKTFSAAQFLKLADA